MWAVTSVRLRSDENPLNHGDRPQPEKVGGDLETKRRRKDEEKTERIRREGAERGLSQ